MVLQPASANKSGICLDQVLTPVDPTLYPEMGDIPAGYRPRTLMHLTRKLWHGTSAFGHAPLHFITQRGPFQDGTTPIALRYDDRVLQVLIGESVCDPTEWMDKRWDILDLLRPNRSFGCGVRPYIYRRWLPDGHIERGNDLVTTAGSAIVTSHDGRFFDRGGLYPGAQFTITTGPDTGDYTIVAVPNDYTLQLDANMAATSANIGWRYRRSWSKRDLFCLLESGPTFDEGPGAQPYAPMGYYEALRFVAHDPFWYGQAQQETWDLEGNLPDLTFYLYPTVDIVDGGAWFPWCYLYGSLYALYPGTGRWDFQCTDIQETTEVVYWGTAGARPVFTVTGPFDYVSISNDSIDTELVLDYTAAIGETVTIDTLNLTVTNDSGDNLLSNLTGDLATFVISPAPQAPDRVNSITVNLTGGGEGVSAVVMTWRNRYVGI